MSSNPESDSDDIGKSVEKFLKNPEGYPSAPPDPNIAPTPDTSKFPDGAKEFAIEYAQAILSRSGNVGFTRQEVFNYTVGVGATKDEATDFLMEIGLGAVGTKRRVELLKEAAREFIESKSSHEALERAMQLYPPTPAHILLIMEARLKALQNPQRETDQSLKPPPLSFFRHIRGLFKR